MAELSHGIVSQAVHQGVQAAAVRRLEDGDSIAEVARGLEVNAKVLHRWRRALRQGPGNAFPGKGQRRWSEDNIAQVRRFPKRERDCAPVATHRPRTIELPGGVVYRFQPLGPPGRRCYGSGCTDALDPVS
jgi:transposase-like protein